MVAQNRFSSGSVVQPLHSISKLLVRLHALIESGQGDSDQADAMRDLMDWPWYRMSPSEQEVARQLSADLYALHETEEKQHPRDAKVCTPGLASALSAASERGEYLKALQLIKSRPSEISEERAAMLRGVCYEKMGLFDTGLEFFEHAASVAEDSESINAFILASLLIHGRTEDAAAKARRLLCESDKPTIGLRRIAAEMLFALAAKQLGSERAEITHEAETQYLAVLSDLNDDPHRLDSSHIASHCHSMLAACYLILDRQQDSIAHITLAIKADPNNAFLYVQRGLQLSQADFQVAKRDFHKAIELGTQDCWPFYYIALDAIKSGDYDRCILMCEAAARRTDDFELLAILHEWTAISLSSKHNTLAELPVKSIRHHFNLAMSLSPANQTIAANLASFESTLNEARSQAHWQIGVPIDPSMVAHRAVSQLPVSRPRESVSALSLF